MLQFLESELGPDDRVLDLGSGHGSFSNAFQNHPVVHLDIESERLAGNGRLSTCANAASMPFRDRMFALVVANHSLEHIDQLESALNELDRVLTAKGTIFITVPDASTLSDKLYRWLANGGGHVNAFVNVIDLINRIESTTHSRCAYQKVLHSGFTFLNRRGNPNLPRRAWLLGGGFEFPLALATLTVRMADRMLGTRLSVYGWCLIFTRRLDSELSACVDGVTSNVCIRCGAGHSFPSLARQLKAFFGLQYYRCPACSALNFFTGDPEKMPSKLPSASPAGEA